MKAALPLNREGLFQFSEPCLFWACVRLKYSKSTTFFRDNFDLFYGWFT